MGDRRVLLGTSAVLVGLGLMTGTAVSAADTGETDASPTDTSASAAAGTASAAPSRQGRRAAARTRTVADPAAATDDSPGTSSAPRSRTTPRPARAARPSNDEIPGAVPQAVTPSVAAQPAAPSAAVIDAVEPAAEAAGAPVADAVAPAPDVAVIAEVPEAPGAYAAPSSQASPVVDTLAAVLTGTGPLPTGDAVAAVPALAAYTGQRQSAAPAAVVGANLAAAAPPDPNLAAAPGAALLPNYPTNGVTGVQVGQSRLAIPGALFAESVPADWYFPTQVDGTVQANGVIWLQHGFGATNTFYSALAQDLAQRTNSIVVAPSLSSIPITFSGGCLICTTSQEAAAAAFLDPNRTALVDSAVAAGYTGDVNELKGRFVLAGHSAGGGFATATAADYIGAGSDAQDNNLLGVVMFDGVSNGAVDGSLVPQLQTLGAAGKPIYQIAAPAQTWNLFGATTNVLAATLPGEFIGVVLQGGSHVDSMLGVNPLFDFVLQLVTQRVPAGNTDAVYTLSNGWINDMYDGFSPADPGYGLYAASNQQIIMGPTAATGLPALEANNLSFGDTIIKGLIDAVGGLFGFQLPAPVNSGDNGLDPNDPVAQVGNGVTGVRTGTSSLLIPSGEGYNAPADWYFPTQADGTVTANGMIWLQHGFLGFKDWYADMAMQLARETTSIVVAPQIFWFDPAFSGVAAADMFVGSRGALNISANAAGLQGPLPQKFILTGHSAGGNFATVAGAGTVDNGSAADLLGVVMFDGVSRPGVFAPALAKLDSLDIPDYQIAAPPQRWNAWGGTTEELAQLHPDQFIGTMIDNGSHTDVIAGDNLFGWLGSFFSSLIVKPSPPGGKDAVRTFATGWINDIYSGTFGPTNPGYGIYGNPNDGTFVPNQSISMGQAGATTLPAPPPVDVAQYAGTWYEQGSVKQFFSIGLVNT
ncbi:MAG: hypothetical protein ACR2JM_11560, partial [Mycobacterium sp.]